MLETTNNGVVSQLIIGICSSLVGGIILAIIFSEKFRKCILRILNAILLILTFIYRKILKIIYCICKWVKAIFTINELNRKIIELEKELYLLTGGACKGCEYLITNTKTCTHKGLFGEDVCKFEMNYGQDPENGR